MNFEKRKKWIKKWIVVIFLLLVAVGVGIAWFVHDATAHPSRETTWYITIDVAGKNEPIIMPVDMAAGPAGMESQKEELKEYLATLVDNAVAPSVEAARLCKISISHTKDGVRKKKFPFVLLVNTPAEDHPYTLAQEKSEGGELRKAADFDRADDLKQHSVGVVFLALSNAESVRKEEERR
ncbi:MAG: hypothetical protein MPJ50_07635 [Pirellulales bacterium]|nr:hypothetical protein [Pirellulales bacterium]